MTRKAALSRHWCRQSLWSGTMNWDSGSITIQIWTSLQNTHAHSHAMSALALAATTSWPDWTGCDVRSSLPGRQGCERLLVSRYNSASTCGSNCSSALRTPGRGTQTPVQPRRLLSGAVPGVWTQQLLQLRRRGGVRWPECLRRSANSASSALEDPVEVQCSVAPEVTEAPLLLGSCWLHPGEA